jgi:hypothetical protein
MHPIENYIPLILSMMCEAIINLIRFKISHKKIRNHNYFTTMRNTQISANLAFQMTPESSWICWLFSLFLFPWWMLHYPQQTHSQYLSQSTYALPYITNQENRTFSHLGLSNSECSPLHILSYKQECHLPQRKINLFRSLHFLLLWWFRFIERDLWGCSLNLKIHNVGYP